MVGAFFGDRERAGVDVGKSYVAAECRDVRVTAEKELAVLQGRGIVLSVQMTVCGEDIDAIERKPCVVRHDGEFKHHLVNLCLAVSAYAQKLVCNAVEKLDDLLGRVVGGKIVSGTVIEQISKKQELFGGFFAVSVD